MKLLNIKSLLILSLMTITPLSSFINKQDSLVVNKMPNEAILKLVDEQSIVNEIQCSIGVSDSLYKEKIAYLESRGRYDTTSIYGYLGKYQFSKTTLKGLGYSKEEIKGFIASATLQEKAMNKLTLHNYEILSRYGLLSSVGKTIGGTTITIEGMLAGAHLCGPYAVKKFIQSGGAVNEMDANSTSVYKYMEEFA